MRKISYAGYRFPPEVIHQAIWVYLRFTLSFRDVEDLLASARCNSSRAPDLRRNSSQHMPQFSTFSTSNAL
jgi:transposase-like protein